jgi:hypothetical protein
MHRVDALLLEAVHVVVNKLAVTLLRTDSLLVQL